MKHFRSILVFTILFNLSCGRVTKQTPQLWESKERKISFQCYAPWTLLPTLDTKTTTMTGVIDNSDGKSYIIHITDDVPKEKLSDESYFGGVRKTMLQANSKNRLIKEDSIPFHGQIFHRQAYFMHTDNWGLLKQISFVKRTGKEFYSIQVAFPTQESDSIDITIPPHLIEFDKGVKVDGK
jgi:hypothetical protein